MGDKRKLIKNILGLIVIIIAITVLVIVYRKYNYNNFIKSVRERDKTEFTRDQEIKCSKMDSYKIENIDYNDAMFYDTISVKPNTPYKVTCKVKTENVVNESGGKSGGAHICIAGGTEKSIMLSGTQEWQELEFLFNSKDRTEVEISFRLGGYEEKSKGTAWFSDFKVEEGAVNKSNKWKVGCFIFPKINVDVSVNGNNQHVSLEMSNDDIQDLKTNMERFKNSVQTMSRNKMSVDYDLYTIDEPIKTLSYDNENGYYVSPEDVYEYINSYIEQNEYDHIYVGIRMADKQKGNTILTNDWIGLGGMEYLGIGYSNIRLPDSESNYAYKYNYQYNTFPEEVFIHEFLHTLERNSKAYGFEIPVLHDFEKYGYKEDKLNGQKDWYIAYMNKEINYNGTKIGLPEEIYRYKPVHESNFKYGRELKMLKEPENIIEVVRSLFNRVGKLFTYNKDEVTEFSSNSI